MKVAVTQFAPELRNKSINIQRMEDFCLEAHMLGANLVVFPELATTGYAYLSEKAAREDAEVIGEKGETFSRMLEVARETNMTLVWGMMEVDPKTGELHNSQVLLTPEGRWETARKLNSFGNDFLWATPGTKPPPILTHLGHKIGLLICRDVRDKSDELDSIYSKGDASLVCFSANWGAGAFPANSWMSFVKNNNCWLAVSNRYGKEENLDFGFGGIGIISPEGKVFCDGVRWGQDCMVVADI